MCKVTYQPVKKGLVLTSGRDEHISRSTGIPRMFHRKGRSLLHPGSAFKEYARKDPYRKNRVKIILKNVRICIHNEQNHA